MKSIFLIAIFSLFSFSLLAQNDLSGNWLTKDHNTIVKIEEQDGICTGQIISSDNEKAKPGTLIIKDVKLKKGKWEGQMYAPKLGKWHDAEFYSEGNNLKIVVNVGFFSRIVEWKRS